MAAHSSLYKRGEKYSNSNIKVSMMVEHQIRSRTLEK